jgi:hypothetical protein
MSVNLAAGMTIQVNLSDWKSIAHSLRILANTFESANYHFATGSYGLVLSPDGTSCGGWVVDELEVSNVV